MWKKEVGRQRKEIREGEQEIDRKTESAMYANRNR